MRPVGIIAQAVEVTGSQRPARPAWVSPGQARRLDPLATLIAAAVDRLPRATLTPETAIVVGTAWGSVHSTLGFVDGIAQWGDAGSSPAAFTTSVHHHPAGSLGELLGIHGPAATISCGGTSGLAALRWAVTMLGQDRAPTALVIAADLPSTWSSSVVAQLSRCQFTIGGGATALLLSCNGGRTVSFSPTRASLPVIDAGGSTPAEERLLAKRGGSRRLRTSDQLGAWWPTAALAGLAHAGSQALLVRELSDGILLEAQISEEPGA